MAFDVVDRRDEGGRTVLELVETAPVGGAPAVTITLDVVTQVADVPDGTGNPGDGGGVQPFTPPAGAQNVENITNVGSSGADGRDGFGFEVLGVVVGRSARRGEDGGNGPTITETFDGDPTSSGTAAATPGITVVSQGGDGGQGGDAFLSFNIDAAQGGRGGNGGEVNITVDRQVATAGVLSHGILAQSRAGEAGDGGDAFITIIGDGGTGGPPSTGGAVEITNRGQIQVTGDLSAGILAQSFGGSGGEGGNGFGLVGQGGDASEGGNGGDVTVTNDGDITTTGAFGFGINAQSIGGNSGNAGGLIAFGSGSSNNAGDDAGDVTILNTSEGDILTTNVGAYGIIGQSIGGGGGIGGGSAGLVALGGSGAAGGEAGEVAVTSAGAISTQGLGAKGVLAQSIGGSGGSTELSLGTVSIGGQSGDGDTVTNTGTIQTGADGGRVNIHAGGIPICYRTLARLAFCHEDTS